MVIQHRALWTETSKSKWTLTQSDLERNIGYFVLVIHRFLTSLPSQVRSMPKPGQAIMAAHILILGHQSYWFLITERLNKM